MSKYKTTHDKNGKKSDQLDPIFFIAAYLIKISQIY